MRKNALLAYIVILNAILVAVLVKAAAGGTGFDTRPVTWVVLTALLCVTEYVSYFFYGRHAGRISLSTAEAVLVPMMFFLTFPQVVVGATLANAVARLPRWRVARVKEAFNIGQYGVAAAAAAFFWTTFNDGSGELTPRNSLVVALAATVFQVATHMFVAVAITIAERKSLRTVSAAVAPATVVNLGGSIMVGLIFTASYLAAGWTIALFPILMGGLYLGYRAVLQQAGEKERVEQLHIATRALSSSPQLAEALQGFLTAVAEIVSASEARAYVQLGGRYVYSAVAEGVPTARMEEAHSGTWQEVLELMARSGTPLIIREDDQDRGRLIANHFGVKNLVAAPLMADDELVGCLIAADRVGAGEFAEAEMQLLAALSNELLLTLDSHRLFAEVAEERERFARIFNGSKEGICLLDADGFVRAWNPALERITGYAASEIMGSRWSDRVMIRDSHQIRVEGTDLVSLASDAVVEVVTRDGPTRWVSVISGPVQSETEGGGWVVLVRDVTAEHEVEKAKSDFLSTISHELRTPLTTIKGSLQVLGRGTANLPTDLTEQMIGVTTRGAERLERLVMNLLIVSQIESGAMPVFTEELSMPDVVRERVKTILRDHDNVALEVPSETIHVRADRERLSQVVEHLLENALKFGGSDGKISIAIGRLNGYAHLTVSDEGRGIPAADHERVFERFVRLGDVLTRETQGAGVGLFIAKSAVEAMQGHIWVESELGKGATFHVEIPLARPVAVGQAEVSA